MRRGLAALAVIAASMLAAGCGGDDAGEADDAPGAVVLTATATRSSLFDSRRTFRLELTNTSDQALTVDTVQLDSPLFAPLPASPRDTQLAPGQRLLLPVPFGEARCPGSGPSDLVAVVAGDAVAVPLSQQPDGVMDALHEVECAEAAVREAADITLGDDLAVTGPRSASGAIVVRARGATEVTIESLQGNIVFGVRIADESPLLRVDASVPRGRLPVELVVDRCDTHALIESKRTFKFPLQVRLAGGDPALVVVEADGPAREVLAGLIQACIG